MARVECVCLESDVTCFRAYRWANLWGKVGLLGLASRDIRDLQDYRALIEDQILGNTKFTIFPKDALERRGNLSVLLRSNLKTFDIKWLPKAILLRSKIKGGLRLTHLKHYRDDDRTRDGASKKGWRLALLQGCPQFMEELKRFDQDHRFPVGAGHIIIRGGAGRPRGTVERGRGTRGGARGRDLPQDRRQQQSQRHGDRQQQGGPSTQRGDREAEDDVRNDTRNGGRNWNIRNDRSYDANYPQWGRHRERDGSNGGGRGSRGHSANAAWGSNGPNHRNPGK